MNIQEKAIARAMEEQSALIDKLQKQNAVMLELLTADWLAGFFSRIYFRARTETDLTSQSVLALIKNDPETRAALWCARGE